MQAGIKRGGRWLRTNTSNEEKLELSLKEHSRAFRPEIKSKRGDPRKKEGTKAYLVEIEGEKRERKETKTDGTSQSLD